MHERTLAADLLAGAGEAAARRGARLSSAHVRIGDLVDPDSLRLHWDLLSGGIDLEVEVGGGNPLSSEARLISVRVEDRGCA